jgi:hypothetical protein
MSAAVLPASATTFTSRRAGKLAKEPFTREHYEQLAQNHAEELGTVWSDALSGRTTWSHFCDHFWGKG